MAGLAELTGTTYGPFSVPVTGDRVTEFAIATGDEADRWADAAPPMFANAALFSAAPAFLQDEQVVPFTRSLIHSEQSYQWERPLEVGETLEVSGTVEAQRERGALNLVTFSVAAGSDRGTWLTGSSGFMMSKEAAIEGEDEGEPDRIERPPFDSEGSPLPLPAEGERIAEMRCGASRSDLERYAAASEDWNPIHLDHEAARRVGLGGVIVHGLLMAAWLGRLAGRYGSLELMRLRFRSPLRPAVPAVAEGTVRSIIDGRADLDMVLSASSRRLVTAAVSVTR